MANKTMLIAVVLLVMLVTPKTQSRVLLIGAVESVAITDVALEDHYALGLERLMSSDVIVITEVKAS
ncbi:hypothetical protein ACROYT_G022772 [Oculina patagonica]